MILHFLGTGASGGTPGRGRSARFESSLLVREGQTAVLIDVTRHFSRQAGAIDALTAVLLTHAHRDASGGLAQLRRWWAAGDRAPIPVLASPSTIEAVRARFVRLDHCRFVATAAGERRRVGDVEVTPIAVPHAPEPGHATYAWRVDGAQALVYASDVSALTPDLERACDGAAILVIDGAMWQRRLFTHLTIDAELARLCRWPARQIVLTQIGRTAPEHARLEREVARRCPRARPAYDALELAL